MTSSPIFLSLLTLLSPFTSQPVLSLPFLRPSPSSGTILRTPSTKSPPPSFPPSQLFSPNPSSPPSDRYIASLLRSPFSPSAGNIGYDFCIVQITSSDSSIADPTILWESECAPVSTSNTCTLIFDDVGLEVFDDSQSVYNTQANDNHVNTLELLDLVVMRIIDEDGELYWKTSDEPRTHQGCGLPGWYLIHLHL